MCIAWHVDKEHRDAFTALVKLDDPTKHTGDHQNPHDLEDKIDEPVYQCRSRWRTLVTTILRTGAPRIRRGGLGRAKNVAAGGGAIGVAKGRRIKPVGVVGDDGGAISITVHIIGGGPVGSAVLPPIIAILGISFV
jgi:hypothetical protein